MARSRDLLIDDIRPRRSFIFASGTRPDMFPKALGSGADVARANNRIKFPVLVGAKWLRPFAAETAGRRFFTRPRAPSTFSIQGRT